VTNVETWTCPTCRNAVDTPFCPQCGERPIKPIDLTLRGLGVRLVHALTSIDGRMLKTFWRLLRHPGTLTVSYMNGARKPYVSPFALFIVANALFFAIQSMTSTNIFVSPLDSHLNHQDWSELAQSLLAQRLAATHSTLERYAPVFDRAVVLNAKSLVILMVLPFAVLLPLMFFRRRQPFMAHVVFSLHLYAFLLLLFSVALLAAGVHMLFGGAGLKSARVDNVLTVINLVACVAYLYLATGPVYGATGAMRCLKALVLAVAVGVIVLGYRFALFLITLYGT
jgi:hypothetical protein